MSAAQEALTTTIRPVLDLLASAHGIPHTASAEAMLLAIGLQESLFEHRDQLEMQNGVAVPGAVGPATGWWQFEKNGGVANVMTHRFTSGAARMLVSESGLAWDRDAIWRAFTDPAGDQLATAFARLNLYTDPAPLPAATPEAAEEAFQYYLRIWRPGAWTRGSPAQREALRTKWNRNWTQALALVGPPATATPTPVPATPPPSNATPPSGGSAEASALSLVVALERRVAELERRLAAAGEALR